MRKNYMIAICALALAPTVAGAATSAPPVTMPLGAATSPPLGFTELCQRAPAECLTRAGGEQRDTTAVQAKLEAISLWAGRARWAILFGAREIDAPPAAAYSNASYAGRVPSRPITYNLSFALAVEPSPAEADVTPAETPEPVAEATLSARELEKINNKVNREIRRGSDAQIYGRNDYWAPSSVRVKRGDCEDYVLAKRRALIEAGVADEALSIALVRTRYGEMHAVLLVATSNGEMVLDNLSPWIVPWNEAPYSWINRQLPGHPMDWVRVGGAS